MTTRRADVAVYVGDRLADYHFGPDHPFGPYRYQAFMSRFVADGLDRRVSREHAYAAREADILLFHRQDFVAEVKRRSELGSGAFDGDTPVFKDAWQVASTVVGTVIRAVDDLMDRRYRRAFVPIAGLHHAGRGAAAGFCLLNDCGIAIEILRQRYGLQRVAYVDIDAHHGDGVFYAFEFDPDVVIADIHEDGRYLYPGSGDENETGRGDAAGTKLNLPLAPQADDAAFAEAWARVEAFLHQMRPEFVILQCGADCLAGDPLTHLELSANAHATAVRGLCDIADRYADGRLLVTGGGGYNGDNIAEAWCTAVETLLAETRS